jgi:hypothetical protein
MILMRVCLPWGCDPKIEQRRCRRLISLESTAFPESPARNPGQCLGDCLSLHKSGGSRSGNCFKRWRGQGFPYAGCTAQGRLAQVSRPRRTNVWLTATSPAPAQSLLTNQSVPRLSPARSADRGRVSTNSRRKAQTRSPPDPERTHCRAYSRFPKGMNFACLVSRHLRSGWLSSHDWRRRTNVRPGITSLATLAMRLRRMLHSAAILESFYEEDHTNGRFAGGNSFFS